MLQKKRSPLGHVMFLAVLIAIGGAVYFYTRPETGRRPVSRLEETPPALQNLREHADAVEKNQADEYEAKQRKLIESLRAAKDDDGAREALIDCFRKGGSPAQVGLMEANFDLDPKAAEAAPEARKILSERSKMPETAEELIAEIKKVAVAHPKGFRAAYEAFREATKPPDRGKAGPKPKDQ